MTQEEKQLLLKDLCARLLYGVKGRYCLYDGKGNLTDWGNEPEIVENIDLQKEKIWTDDTVQGYYLDEFKPYLRPMSSMTEEENEELKYVIELGLQALDGEEGHNTVSAAPAAFEIDFYNKHHFDYRGLIKKGLALEAPEDMYKNKLN